MMDHIYKSILDSLDNYIVVIQDNGAISFTNKTWGELTKKLGSAEGVDWIGKNYFECCSILQLNANSFVTKCRQGVESVLNGSQDSFLVEFAESTVNDEIWLAVKGSVIYIEEQKYIILDHSNIINKKKSLAKIEKLTLTDSVTGLANQKSFNLFYFNEWQRSMRNRTEMALMIGELEGNAVDDKQRHQIADIFSRHARRACDFAAILKSNQFSLILGQVEAAACERVAQSIYQEIESLNLLASDGKQIHINIGISSATPTLIDTSDMLYNSVSLALKKSKASRVECITSHCPTIRFKEVILVKN